jgi:hypothetical protein
MSDARLNVEDKEAAQGRIEGSTEDMAPKQTATMAGPNDPGRDAIPWPDVPKASKYSEPNNQGYWFSTRGQHLTQVAFFISSHSCLVTSEC